MDICFTASRRFALWVFSLVSTACAVAPVRAADIDQDGIDDAVERLLLARFTPLLRFSLDDGVEPYRPMDARQYVQWSELQSDGDKGKGVILRNAQLLANPSAVLGAGTNVISETRLRQEDRFLSPMDNVPRPGQWARHGWDWRDVTRNKNVGLYGHVVPIRLANPQTDFLDCQPPAEGVARDAVLCAIDVGPGRTDLYYKVEYWQFFGYNGAGKPFDLGDHEADWCSVQVIVESSSLALVQVHHFFHGRIAAFDLRKHPNFALIEGGAIREYRGSNWPKDVSATWYSGPVADAQNRQAHKVAQNNVVRLARDPSSGAFTHPVVYVEHGSHEFWPTAAWSFQDSPNHNGDDAMHTYQTAPPPNLGEVEHPLNETPDAGLLMQYNGRWGAYSRENSSPQGPALHDSWTWPAQSSVRWRIPKTLGF